MRQQAEQSATPVNAAPPAARGLLQRKCACGTHTIAGSKCEACERASRPLQRNANQGAAGDVPSIVHDVLRSPGQPLDTATRAFMEPRFAQDLSRVRVRTDAKAAESARVLNALAYTVGPDVVFGAGQYAPRSRAGDELLAHELTHTVQQQHGGENSRLLLVDSVQHESEADAVADAIHSTRAFPPLKPMRAGWVSRQSLAPEETPQIERNFVLDPKMFLKPMDAPAEREQQACEQFPGGSTDCEVDGTGTPTGKVSHKIDETNRCTRPCVEKHEQVHVKQLKKFCPELGDCYRAADKGKRPVTDCFRMATSGTKERECAAYKVSVPCMENRLKTAKDCQSKEDKEYGMRKLASEICFRDKACAAAGK